jgi:putative molybdopterin biosynthesis protein
VLVDGLLSRAGVRAAGIAGYDRVERNHLAVAAAVASGHADAGFGLRAAAAEYGLGFVALLREHYYLAAHARDTTREPLAQLLEVLRGTQFAQHVRRFPGCSAAGAGTIEPLSVLDRD